MSDEQEKPPELLPASEMIDRELLELALESHARAVMYPESKVQHDRANECKDELLKRLNVRADIATANGSEVSDIERLARDLVWSPESWDAYLIAKEQGDGPAEDPEFWLLAQAVEAAFGPQPPCPEDLAYADKVITKVKSAASDDEVDAILRKADIEPESLVNEFIERLGRELRAAIRERDAARSLASAGDGERVKELEAENDRLTKLLAIPRVRHALEAEGFYRAMNDEPDIAEAYLEPKGTKA